MNHTSSGYQFDRLSIECGDRELQRLYYQASLLLPQERDIWLASGLQAGMDVIDIGCGTGVITRAIADIARPGKVVGIDISEKLIDRSRYLLDRDPIENLSFEQGDIYNLNLPDNYYDFIYARLLFQHLDRPLVALANLQRILKPGGIICIVDVDEDWFSIYPEPESFARLRLSLSTLRAQISGDVKIGRKLPTYLAQTGFRSITTQIKVIDSDRLGFARFIDLLSFGATYQHLQPDLKNLAERAREDLENLTANNSAWGGFGLFAIAGKKP